jgi:hypothetical protein
MHDHNRTGDRVRIWPGLRKEVPLLAASPRRLRLLCLGVPLLAVAAVACSAAERTDQPSPATQSEAAETREGQLIYSEQLGKSIKVEFWKTAHGAASIVTGSLDEDQALSNQVNAALDRPSVEEAYRALPHDNGDLHVPAPLLELDTQLKLEEAARVTPSSAELERFDSTLENFANKTRELAPASAADYQPLRPMPKGGLRTQAPPAGWNWNSDYQWFRDNFCVGAQDCRTGFTWLYGGAKSNLTYHRTYGLNNSFDGTADFGARWARWENGAWVWHIDTRTTLAARNYIGITRYGGVGPFLRDGWVSGYAVTNTLATSPTFTTTPLGTDPRTSFSQVWTPFAMKGYNSSTYGSQYYNRCANNVVASFNAIPTTVNGKILYKSMGGQQLPPFNATLHTFGAQTNHIQGIARLPGVGDNRWVAVTRAHDVDRAGLFLVNLGDLGGTDGTRFGNSSGDPSSVRASKYYYPIAGVAHPGGIQAVGKYVAVGVEAPSAPSFVEFFNFSTPGSSTASIQRFYLWGDQAENPPPARVVGGVGMTRLSDGRYLISVLGKDDSNDVWFYVSDTTSITASTYWSYLEHFRPVSSGAQNVALITECGTGDIYLLATGNTEYPLPGSDDNNTANLWRVTYTDFTVSLTSAAVRNFNSGSGDYCTFRAGASPYVDPNGNLAIHCHTHHANTNVFGDPDSKLKMAEFSN